VQRAHKAPSAWVAGVRLLHLGRLAAGQVGSNGPSGGLPLLSTIEVHYGRFAASNGQECPRGLAGRGKGQNAAASMGGEGRVWERGAAKGRLLYIKTRARAPSARAPPAHAGRRCGKGGVGARRRKRGGAAPPALGCGWERTIGLERTEALGNGAHAIIRHAWVRPGAPCEHGPVTGAAAGCCCRRQRQRRARQARAAKRGSRCSVQCGCNVRQGRARVQAPKACVCRARAVELKVRQPTAAALPTGSPAALSMREAGPPAHAPSTGEKRSSARAVQRGRRARPTLGRGAARAGAQGAAPAPGAAPQRAGRGEGPGPLT
jgi:hypothetical protein